MGANPLQIAPKSRLLETRARLIFRGLLQQYRQGQIRSKAELMSKLFGAIRTFYTTIGQPVFKPRLAAGAPQSSEYNGMMAELHQDLVTLFAEADLMGTALQESFTYAEMDRQMLAEQLTRSLDQIRNLEAAVDALGHERVFRESFLDRSNFDTEIVDGTLADINLQARALTLNTLEMRQFSDEVTLRLLESSNGFPGNTHQVRAVAGRYKFYGEDNLHLNLAEILDGSADTWFEYESFVIADDILDATGRLGFDYKEGITWAGQGDKPLRLVLEAELRTAQTLNWLTITPFLPSERGAVPAKVVSIRLDDGKGGVKEIAGGEVLREDAVYLFARQKVKRVVVHIEQDVPYEAMVGHVYFKEMEQSSVSFFETGRTLTGRRVDGPLPSVEALGFRYDPFTQSVSIPAVHKKTSPPDQALVAGHLFALPEVQDQVQVDIEALPAMRYAIGLRDMGFATYRFGTEASYISKLMSTNQPIRSITLDVDAWVPQEFGPGEWIQYAISVDGGQTYHRIAPRGSIGTSAKVQYLVDSHTPAEGRSERVGYLDPAAPVHDVRLKITLRRPAQGQDVDYYTPILREYRLNIATERGR